MAQNVAYRPPDPTFVSLRWCMLMLHRRYRVSRDVLAVGLLSVQCVLLLRVPLSCCSACVRLCVCSVTSTKRLVQGLRLQNDGTFYLIDDVPKFAKYMSEPIKSQQSASPLDTPGYFVAGIVKGYLVSSGFQAECDPR